MGKLPYVTLTNTQAAYRLPNLHEDFMARLEARAAHLWDDGYRVWPTEQKDVYRVYQPGPDPDSKSTSDYTVCLTEETCTCAFFRKQDSEPLNEDGSKVACKHLRGLPGLMEEEIEYWTMLREWGNPYNEAAYTQNVLELEQAWGK